MLLENVKIISYKIEKHFAKRFEREPEIVIQSPGRINIIGEHTDYNDGYVLPAAIDHYMYVGISKSDSDQVSVYSVDYDENASIDLTNLQRTDNEWLNLISGILSELKGKIGGFDMAFGGNIPEGAGVSSSAALCCGLAMALSELFDLRLEKWEMAKIAQKSEHNFANVQCGIMDQFACLFGLTNHVLLLDCKSLDYQESEVDMAGFKFLLLNSNVKHNLGDSEYNSRRAESEKAIELIKEAYPKVKSYQDVRQEMLYEIQHKMSGTILNRALHIVSENTRVLEINDKLKSGSYEEVGKLLTEGHMSEKHHYEITCEETDFIVDELTQYTTVLGARQVGGGFGGCVLALVKDAATDEIVREVAKNYRKTFNLKLDQIPIKISEGCHRIK